MKKKYQTPATDIISLGTEEVMVPNQMSNPTVGGANDYVFEGLDLSRGDLEQMVGNAVPVSLAQFIAERLKEYMDNANRPENDRASFAAWLREEKKYVSDRSIGDVFSRVQRAKRILPDRPIDKYFIVDLQRKEEYQKLDVSVKSQIKKAISLRVAFDEWAMNNE